MANKNGKHVEAILKNCFQMSGHRYGGKNVKRREAKIQGGQGHSGPREARFGSLGTFWVDRRGDHDFGIYTLHAKGVRGPQPKVRFAVAISSKATTTTTSRRAIKEVLDSGVIVGQKTRSPWGHEARPYLTRPKHGQSWMELGSSTPRMSAVAVRCGKGPNLPGDAKRTRRRRKKVKEGGKVLPLG